jgi:hypothetical protein
MMTYWLSPTYWFSTKLQRSMIRINRREQAGIIDAFVADLERLTARGDLTFDNRLDVEVKHGRITTKDADLRRIDHRLETGVIDAFAADLERLVVTGGDSEEARIGVQLKHGKITAHEHEKASATARNEPWIGIIDHGYNAAQGTNGLYFEFDWNDHWIEYLRLNGYGGKDEESLVQQWFSDVCRSQIVEAEEEDNVIPIDVISQSLADLKRK